ncbi:MAG TPA: roadblock/LC7 domain-containing protein [Planktothrix sp.]|jgi:predicted regulator of Ras-like GTPase activity (Roadblock/LC7/MglB family)
MHGNEKFQNLLERINAHEKVIGSVLVGDDGEIFAQNLPEGMDPRAVGVWGLAMCQKSGHSLRGADAGELTQIGARTTDGCIVVTEFSAGAIVTMTNGGDSKTLVPLMHSVAELLSEYK